MMSEPGAREKIEIVPGLFTDVWDRWEMSVS